MSKLAKRLVWLAILGAAVLASVAYMKARGEKEPVKAVNRIALDVKVKSRKTHRLRIKINLRSSISYVPHSDEYSDFSTQLVLVRDRSTGDLVSVVRQTDKDYNFHDIYVPKSYLDKNRRFLLELSGSLDWMSSPEGLVPVEVVAVEPIDSADYFQQVEISLGKPDDIPFLGENISYAEGALLMPGTWFFNKFFRYGNDGSTLRLPLEPNSAGFLKFNVYFSEKSKVSLNGRELEVFDRSTGTRFSQDYYRVRFAFDDAPTASVEIENVLPFRGVPTNMRQFAYAFNSIEIATGRSGERGRLDLRGAMNSRLDYRHGKDAIDRLLNPSNAVEELLRFQGGAWLPRRDAVGESIDNANGRISDAVVLLDPVLEEIANTSYSSGDFWVNSATGAAMLLEDLGYSVRYAFPDDLPKLNPSLIYIPSQPFYEHLFSPEAIDKIRGTAAHVIVEPSFSRSFYENETFASNFKFSFPERAQYIPWDNVNLETGEVIGGFAATPVFRSMVYDGEYRSDSTLDAHKDRLVFNADIDGTRVSILAFPASYYFYNYGFRSHRALVSAAVAWGRTVPLLKAVSRSRVRAYFTNMSQCKITLRVENNNYGSFNYYGFAKAFPVRAAVPAPPVSEVRLDSSLLAAGKSWSILSVPPVPSRIDDEGRVHLFNVGADTLVTIEDRACR